MPAFDRLFIGGARVANCLSDDLSFERDRITEKGKSYFPTSLKSDLKPLFDLACRKDVAKSLQELAKNFPPLITKNGKVHYPAMRIFDQIFWAFEIYLEDKHIKAKDVI